MLSSLPGGTADFRPCSCRLQAQVLGFQVFLDAVARALAAQAGLLDAAEGRDLVGDQAGVDAHHAVLQRTRYAPDAAVVVCGQISGPAADGGVWAAHPLLPLLGTEQRRPPARG